MSDICNVILNRSQIIHPYPLSWWIWVFVLLLPVQVAAQSGNRGQSKSATIQLLFNQHRQYTQADGLSSNYVTAMVQDPDGFMWFGTTEGVNRFDGEQFLQFFSNPDGSGLPVNEVNRMLLLPDYRILVGTSKGICIIHTRQLTVTRVLLPAREL